MRKSFGQHIEQSHRERHIQLAVVGGIVVSGLSLIPGMLMTNAGEPGGRALMVLGVVYLSLTVGVYRRKFVAAVLLLALFIVTRLSVGATQGIIWSAVFVYVVARAAKELWDLRSTGREVATR